MSLTDLILPIGLSAGGASALTVAAWKLFNRYYVSVPPNRALVLYGRRSSGPRDGTAGGAGGVEFRPPRILVGGGAYVPPWRTETGYLSLEPVDVDVAVRVSSPGGDSAPVGWEARISLQVKIPAEPSMLRAAAENLLGRSEEDIRRLVARTVEGATPPVLTRVPPDEGNVDWERLATEIQASTARDLVANGLVIRSLSLTELRRFSGSGEVRARRGLPALPVPEVHWTPGDPSVRLGALQAPFGRGEPGLPGDGTDLGASPREGALEGAPPRLPLDDSTGSALPSRPPPVPASGTRPGRGGGRRTPLDAKQ